jgi:hypothetical protein
MEEKQEPGFDWVEQEEVLKIYGKSFLTDTIKDFQKPHLNEDETKKWEAYQNYFIETRSKQNKAVQDIRDEYLSKYILLVTLMSEYEKTKEDFDRQNLKVEVVLSDILLHAKDEKIQKIFAQWIADKEKQILVFREIIKEVKKPVYAVKTSAVEIIANIVSKAVVPLQAEIKRLGEMFQKANPSKYNFENDMKHRAKWHGIAGLLEVPCDNYLRGLVIESMIEDVCKKEQLSVKVKRDMLKVNSFKITQARIIEIYDEIKSSNEDFHRAYIDNVFRRYRKIEQIKKLEISALIEKEMKLFKLKSDSLKGKSIFEKQFELQPLVKCSVDTLQEKVKTQGGW